MSERSGNVSAGGSSWSGREDSSWWTGNGQQHQNPDQVPRTASATQQIFSYKVASGGFSNDTPANQSSVPYEYRAASHAPRVNDNNQSQTQWWYANASNERHSPNSVLGQIQLRRLGESLHQNGRRGRKGQSSPHDNKEEDCADRHQQQLSHQSLQLHQVQQTLQQAMQQQQVFQIHSQQTLQQTLQQQQQAQQQHLQALQQAGCFSDFQLSQQTNRMPRVKMETKPRGRMTAYAFFVQACREEHKRERPDESLVFAQFSKKCAERWNAMSDKEKIRFHELAEQDKKRYEFEMESYTPPGKEMGGRGKGKKKKMPKDPNAPKRSLSAFFWFCNDERAKVKAAYPTYTMGDIAKELGRRWAACDPPTKGKYESLSEKDKARYDQEMTAYKKGPLAMNVVDEAEGTYH